MLHRLTVRLVCALACAGTCLGLLAASPAQALVVKLSNGHRLGVMLAAGHPLPSGTSRVSARSATSAACDRTTDNGVLNYQCGPVVHSSAPYLIFWDPSGAISAQSRQLMERYLTDAATAGTADTDVYGTVRQYFDGSGYAGGSQTFSSATQALVDTQAYPATDTSTCSVASPYTACLTDTQVQSEITRLIQADGLPAGGVSKNAPIYFVVLPQATDECISAGTCASSAFCAYHSSYPLGGTSVLYSIIPFAIWNFGPKGCQTDGTSVYQSPNSDQADNVIDNLSHEFNETVTDPLGTGWWDSATGTEVADLCEQTGPLNLGTQQPTDPNAYLPTLGGSSSAGTLYDQLINGHQYYTQTAWSNGENDCKTQPAASTLSPAFTTPTQAAAGNSISFDPTASTATAGVSSATWDFGDGNTSFSSGTPAAVAHTYALPGQYTVTLTLVDTHGNVTSVQHGLNVGSPPTAAFTAPATAPVDQPVSFDGTGSSDPNQGGSITSYAWDFGDGAHGTGATPQHTYGKPGTYNVSLTVTDSYGFTSSAATRQIVVQAAPPSVVLSAPGAPVAAGQAVGFDASQSTDPNTGGSIASYRWSFGDGSLGLGATVSHAFTKPGTYAVTVTVTDSYGLASTKTVQVVVEAPGAITKTAVKGKKRTRYLLVTVTQGGRIAVGKHSVTMPAAGTARFKLALSRAQVKALAAHRKVRLRVTISYAPAVGAAVKVTRTFTLR